MKKYFVNLMEAGKKSTLEIGQPEYDRISKQLVREINGGPRIIIHEKLESGDRTHFLRPSQIISLDEFTEDEWTQLP